MLIIVMDDKTATTLAMPLGTLNPSKKADQTRIINHVQETVLCLFGWLRGETSTVMQVAEAVCDVLCPPW